MIKVNAVALALMVFFFDKIILRCKILFGEYPLSPILRGREGDGFVVLLKCFENYSPVVICERF